LQIKRPPLGPLRWQASSYEGVGGLRPLQRRIPRRSRLAGEGACGSGARLSGLFAGKPAPTRPWGAYALCNAAYPVGAGLPAKALADQAPASRASSLASQLLR